MKPFTPVPQVRDLAGLNQYLLDRCKPDEERVIGSRTEATGTLVLRERDFLRPLPKQGIDLAELSFPTTDGGAV